MDELSLTLRLGILVLLLGINSFFAAAEVALVSVRATRMRQLADGGDSRAETVLGLLATPDRMLSATQLGVTLASLGLGWAGEGTVYKLIEPALGWVIATAGEGVAHGSAFVVSFALITYLHMVLGEVVPKNLAMERSERLALAVGPPLEIFATATGFFVHAVKGTAAALSKMMGLRMAPAEDGLTAEELKLVVSVSGREGEHAERQQEMLHRVIDFYDLTVREVMVPRQEMAGLPLESSLEQAIDRVARSRHSRLPVFDGAEENVVGIVHAKDLWGFVEKMERWRALERPTPKFLLRSFVKSVEYVPETKMVWELLEEFQQRRTQLAMVVDEFGTVVGLATAEDALEQIVGEIREEHEEHPRESAIEGAMELDGNIPIRDLDSHYGIELPYDSGFETLAGFLLSRLGHIPEPGESVEYEQRRWTVKQMDQNRIARVEIEAADR